MDEKVICNDEKREHELKAKRVVVLIKGEPTEVNIVPFKSQKDVFKTDTPQLIKPDVDPTFHFHAVVLIPSELNCDSLPQYYDVKSTELGLSDELPKDYCDTILTETDATFLNIKEEKYAEAKHYYNCELCNYATLLKGNMKVHQLKHTGERKFACEHCSYKATQKSSLKTHVLLKHGNPAKLQCTKCDYTTALKGNLKKHLLIHSGVKNFQCPECPFRATQKSTVNTHLNLIHFGSNDMVECSSCDYKTLLKGDMNVHELTHIDELTM